jgi:hypothetical protein
VDSATVHTPSIKHLIGSSSGVMSLEERPEACISCASGLALRAVVNPAVQ